MPQIIAYNREKVLEYTQKFALKRNSKYFNFDEFGGDCTNFCSQCLLEGSLEMNRVYTPLWYYNNINDRSPSWSGVEFLYEYLTLNKNKGPFARLAKFNEIEIGDLVQLKFVDNNIFSHCMVVSGLNQPILSYNDIFVCAHTIDSLNRPLSHYRFEKIRFLHIEGVFVN